MFFKKVFCLVASAAMMVVSAAAQAPQVQQMSGNKSKPPAEKLFEGQMLRAPLHVRSMATTDTSASTTSNTLSCAGVLRTNSGLVATNTTVWISFDANCGISYPVFVAGRQFIGSDVNNLTEVGSALYVPKTLSLGPNGFGAFDSIQPGAQIPLMEVSTGNAGQVTVVQVTFYDQQNLHPPLTLETQFWSQVVPVADVGDFSVRQAAIVPGSIVMVHGSFPKNQPILVEIGNPGMDLAFVTLSSADGSTLQFALPSDYWGNFLYPRQWTSVTPYTLVATLADGTSLTVPIGLVAGEGTANNYGLTFIPQ